ncbi:TPA: hypothetical protein ACHWJ6_001241 [Streptococcus suis]|nr:hypothetical protein [Streptococcus suis]
MKKKLFSFTLLSATLLSLSACGSANTLSNATSQSGSEVTETGEATNSQTTAASSEATTPNLDLDTSNLKLVRNSQEENYTVVDNIEDYVGTYKGYISSRGGGVSEVQTAVFEDGTFQRILTPLVTESAMGRYYLDSSGVVKEFKKGTTVDGVTYDDLYHIIYERGVLVEQFGNVYLVPTISSKYLNVVVDETGQINYTDSLLSTALLSYNKPISTDEEWSDFYQNLKNDFEDDNTLYLDDFDSWAYFADGEYYEAISYSEREQVKDLEGEVSDIVKNSLTESLNKTDVSEYVSSPNALFHLTHYVQDGRNVGVVKGQEQFEIIPPGTAIYDKSTGEQYEVIYGFEYGSSGGPFYAYVGDVFRIIYGTEENGKYIGDPNVFLVSP